MALFELHHHQKREMQSLAKLFLTHSAFAKHVLLTSFSQNWVQIWRTYERTFSILAILSQYLLLFLAFVSCSRDSHSGL